MKTKIFKVSGYQFYFGNKPKSKQVLEDRSMIGLRPIPKSRLLISNSHVVVGVSTQARPSSPSGMNQNRDERRNAMNQVLTQVLIGFMLASAALAQNKAEVSVQTMPPSVVKTVPRAGDMNVHPSLREVRVTFSKDMITKQMWSWAMNSKETFPQIDADRIHYLKDRRTCVLPVKLKPGKTYVIWINSQKYNAFRDTRNNPAVPYLLVFQTGS